MVGSRIDCLIGVVVLLLSFLNGCGSSKPAKLYLLQSLSSSESQMGFPIKDGGVAIGIGPVKIPDYLDRPQIVTRASNNSLQLAEFDRWAEPLEKNFIRVLAENLSTLLSTDRLSIFPWSTAMGVQYQVTMEVERLENTSDGKITLTARWNILGDDGAKLIKVKRSSYSIQIESQGYGGVVAAESKAIEALSREIAAAVNSLMPDQPSA